METSWVLLRLACFFDLNKVYHQLPTYLPTYLRTYLPTYLPTYSVIDSCYNDPSKSKYWKLFWATFVKNKTTVTSLTLFYYFHIGFFFSTRNCNYSISYRIGTNVNTAAIWMQTLSVLGPVHTYPDIFESATFSFRIQKFPRPHVCGFILVPKAPLH